MGMKGGMLTVSYNELAQMGACAQWRSAWRKAFGRKQVAITPKVIATLLDAGYPIDWYISEANSHIPYDDDVRYAKLITLALLRDTVPFADGIDARRGAYWRYAIDQMETVPTIDLPFFYCKDQADGYRDYFLCERVMAAASNPHSLSTVIDAVLRTAKTDTALIKGANLPRSCDAIARYLAEFATEFTERVAEIREARRNQ